MSILSKLSIFIFAITACVQQEQAVTSDDREIASVLTKIPPSSWESDTQFPLQLKYGSNFDPQEVAAIEASANSWSTHLNHKLDPFDFSPSSIEKKESLDSYEDSELGVYKITSWPSHLPKTALAVTQIFGRKINSGFKSEYIIIDHADILINSDNFSFVTNDEWGYDLQTVVLHEMGHFIGLNHETSSVEKSIMFPTISRSTHNQVPKPIDITNILEKYETVLNPGTVVSADASQESNLNKGERVVFVLELHSDGKELIRIKTLQNKPGENDEVIKEFKHDHTFSKHEH